MTTTSPSSPFPSLSASPSLRLPRPATARRLLCLAASVGLLVACGGDDDAATSVTTQTSTIAETTTTAEVFTSSSVADDSTGTVATDAAPTDTDPATDDTTAASSGAEDTDQTTATPATATPATPAPADAAPTTDGAPTTVASATGSTAPPSTSGTIPAALRGTWRESEAGSVTAAECDDINDASNMGRVLEIRADGFSNFEEGGRLLAVYSSDDTSVDALFDTSYAEPRQDRFTFEAQNGGNVLVVTSADLPGPVRYVRCPSATE